MTLHRMDNTTTLNKSQQSRAPIAGRIVHANRIAVTSHQSHGVSNHLTTKQTWNLCITGPGGGTAGHQEIPLTKGQ